MEGTISQYKDDLLIEIEGLSVDPSQSYFWTKKWQNMENEADQDKKAGKIIGDGTLENLLNELNK